jgi:hypothetical protein
MNKENGSNGQTHSENNAENPSVKTFIVLAKPIYRITASSAIAYYFCCCNNMQQ